MPSLPFYLVAAFAKGPFDGNPAAVAFVEETLETDTLEKIALNFKQPILSVVGLQLPSSDETVAAFNIRWFSANASEIPLCGHGTMAAARAVFERGLVPDSVEVIEFHTVTAGVMRARKVGKEGIEIRLPSGTLKEVPAEKTPQITAALTKAFGRDVAIKYMGGGEQGFQNYLVVELDEQENLGKCEVDVTAFLDTGYSTNVITTASSQGEELFVSRMFAPAMLPPPSSEDQVCGSAHCLIGPYWYKKNGFAPGRAFSSKQVSPRGGDLNLFWDQDTAIMRIEGQTFIMASGQIFV
ncbi:hypothetical protein DFH06DRAFT_1086945 [Mycena polygramma]|nr:hypothetical protein DFH06DRAFT_1086945 [Mycena polygramma]